MAWCSSWISLSTYFLLRNPYITLAEILICLTYTLVFARSANAVNLTLKTLTRTYRANYKGINTVLLVAAFVYNRTSPVAGNG